ncbi:MAG: hypothetical protein GY702_14800, partial [Desulfobulbaceae bacterium]|nr:hypothetical protein [Desulfobulbaceae bacterium]
GTIIQFDAELWVDGIQQQTITKSVPVQSQPFFELTVNDQLSPAPVSGQTEIILNYSNVGTTSSDTMLTFPMPQDTTYISSTDGGIYDHGVVTWQLGSMSNGQDGEKRVLLATNGTEGGLIESEPITISGTDASYNNYQVQVATAGWLEDIQTPLMSLTLNPDPVKQGEELNIGAVISNPSSESISNVELRLHYPDHLNSIYTQYITTGGAANSVSCIGDTPTNHCESGET